MTNDYSSNFIAKEVCNIVQLDQCGATSLTYKIQKNGQTLFMKKLRPELSGDKRYRDLFYKEYNTGKTIHNPYIVKYIEITDDSEGLCIIMEYANGHSLKDKIKNEPQYFRNKENIKKLLLQLCNALQALHKKNIVHLDINPANIIISQINGNIKLVDLGFCLSEYSDQSIGSTTKFGAPEVTVNKMEDIDARADIYSIGRVLQYIEEKSGAKFPKYIKKIENRCLQQEKEERYATTGDIINVIKQQKRRMWSKIATTIAVATALTVGFFASGLHIALDNHIGWERGLFPTKFEVDGIFYNITDSEARTVEVTFKGSHHKEFEYEYQGGEIIIPQTVTYKGCTFRVTKFASMAFANPYISKVTIPDGIEVIADSAFTYCNLHGVITIPVSVKKIGVAAFFPMLYIDSIVVDARNSYYDSREGCNAIIETATNTLIAGCINTRIPEGVVNIAQAAFVGAEKLTDITLPASVRTIGEAAFVRSGIVEINIPEGVTRLERYTFQYCENMGKVTLPQSLLTIETAALSHCGYKELIIPENVTTIGDYAFDYCELLEKVVIGPSVESIGDFAFDGCKRLKTVISHIPAENLPSLNNNVFGNIAPDCVLYVPKGTKAIYENTHGWSSFERIVEM